MDEIITSTVAGVIVTLVGTVCGFLASQLKQARKSRDEREQHEAIVNEALRALLFDKIARLHAETVEQGKPAGVEVKRRADGVEGIPRIGPAGHIGRWHHSAPARRDRCRARKRGTTVKTTIRDLLTAILLLAVLAVVIVAALSTLGGLRELLTLLLLLFWLTS